jgi:hypothetical protein
LPGDVRQARAFMTAPGTFMGEDDLPARVEPTAPVSSIAVASLAIAVTPA